MRRREIMKKEKIEALSTKAKYKSTMATNTTALNLAKKIDVKITSSGLSFLLIFFSSLFFFLFFLFLEHRVRVSDDITQSHIRWYSWQWQWHGTWNIEGHRRFWKDDVMQCVNLIPSIWSFRAGYTVVSMDHLNRYIR